MYKADRRLNQYIHTWNFNSVLPKGPALPLFRRSEPSHAVPLRRPNQRLLSIPRHHVWFANFNAFHTRLDIPGGNRANSSANSTSIGRRSHSGQQAARRRHWHRHPQLHRCRGRRILRRSAGVVWQAESFDDRGVGSRVEIDQPE
jgi:hypothetical protein